MAGRQKTVRIYPLTYDEWSQTDGDMNEFFITGGLPGLLHLDEKDEKIDYLSQIVQTYILKDIKGLIK